MTIIVSISQFRQNMADYIAKAEQGDTVILKDEKRNEEIAKIVGKKKFDPETFGKTLKATKGIFTAKNHPEWRTKNDVIKWLRQTRLSFDRSL